MSPEEDKRKAVHLLMMLFQCYVTWALRENRLKCEKLPSECSFKTQCIGYCRVGKLITKAPGDLCLNQLLTVCVGVHCHKLCGSHE